MMKKYKVSVEMGQKFEFIIEADSGEDALAEGERQAQDIIRSDGGNVRRSDAEQLDVEDEE